MTVITAPTLDFDKESDYPFIFLAGGISYCPDWQQYIIDKLNASKINATILNPRRKDFNIADRNISIQQIEWEYTMLQEHSEIILFWFPEETLCPIALFELGKELGLRNKNSSKKLFIGCHPNYERRFDIEQQTRLVVKNTYGFELEIVYSLDELAAQVIESLEWTK